MQSSSVTMIENIGKFAEYLVLTELLKRNIEAYPAISFHQKNYDITVVQNENLVVRVQVKATELQNNSTNNAIRNLDKNFNFLVLVVVDRSQYRYFILKKEEVEREVMSAAGQLYVSRWDGEHYSVKSSIVTYEDKWDKITSCISA